MTDELGRSGLEASFDEINRLWLQFTQSACLELKENNPSTRVKKAGVKEPEGKPNLKENCFICFRKGHNSKYCKNRKGVRTEKRPLNHQHGGTQK